MATPYALKVAAVLILVAVQCEAFLTRLPSSKIARCSSTKQLQSPSPIDEARNNNFTPSPTAITIPPAPELKRVPLPAMLAGGLFLFAKSVPRAQRKFADELLKVSESALRSDPTVVMELGMGVETGGIYASSHASTGQNGLDQLALQFQINGGNAWAQGVAYGVQYKQGGRVALLTLEVANMDAVLNGQAFQIPLDMLSDDDDQ